MKKLFDQLEANKLHKYICKIIAFIFAKRLQKVLNYVVNDNQKANLKGRFRGVYAILVQDIFDFWKTWYGIYLS